MGQETEEDIKEINKRWLENKGIELPADGEICYACPYNKDHNAVSTKLVSSLAKTHILQYMT
eukprot:3319037-Ditylum_brightwellii.AAC.1